MDTFSACLILEPIFLIQSKLPLTSVEVTLKNTTNLIRIKAQYLTTSSSGFLAGEMRNVPQMRQRKQFFHLSYNAFSQQ